MRRSILGPLGSTLLTGIMVLLPVAGTFADEVAESVSSEGSQIVPAGPAAEPQRGKGSLNTIPDDGVQSDTATGPSNGIVRQLLAARPNEDLVICVAGCFSGSDRVVYAQPSEKPMAIKAPGPSSDLRVPGAAKQTVSSNDVPSATRTATAAHSTNPQAPVILNRSSR